MLWIAVHLPRLPLEIFAAPSPREAFAVCEAQRVVLCNDLAHQRGVRAGMALAAAVALAPELSFLLRQPSAEEAALSGLAAWCSQFTPNVSIAAPAILLLEISGSLRLFGGLAAILRALAEGFAAMGHVPAIACAPTPKAASWLAQAGQKIILTKPAQLESALAGLPVSLVAGKAAAELANIGVATLGELAALPRAGVARRFGQHLVDELDRAAGRLPDPRSWHALPERFCARLELPAEVTDCERLLFAAKRLLLRFAGYLCGRGAAVQGFVLKLDHREQQESPVVIGLVAPSRDAEHFLLLLRQRLERLPLAQPVRGLTLAADEIQPWQPENLPLFEGGHAREDWPRLIERLIARLGDEAVHSLAQKPEHRPEHASCPARVALASRGGKSETPASGFFGPRPLWLLPKPQPLSENLGQPWHHGRLKLLAGPERIESGWWAGGDVRRDYFIAASPDHALLWIYRERPAGLEGGEGWYLQGLFS